MSSAADSESDLAVLVGDGAGEGASEIDWASLHVPVDTISDLEAGRASRSVENLAETLVIDGDDRLVSRTLTAFRRRHVGRDRPTQFVPLRVGAFHRIADAFGGPRPSGRLGRQLADGGVPEHWRARSARALRVTTSARPAPVWGFSVGAGIVYRLFETLIRSEGSGISGLSSMASRLGRQLASGGGAGFESRGARVSVDYEPLADELGYLVATALSETWLGLAGGDGEVPSWTGGQSGRHFVARVAGSATLPNFLGGGGDSAFERIHVDGPGGFVVDGELYDPGEPHVLQIARGPRVTFVTP